MIPPEKNARQAEYDGVAMTTLQSLSENTKKTAEFGEKRVQRRTRFGNTAV